MDKGQLKMKEVALSLLVLLWMVSSHGSQAHTLSVSSRWLVHEADGTRAKLACVSWAAHLEAMTPEGLSKQPLSAIAISIKHLGFNCVRLTWPTQLFMNASLSQQTLREAFSGLGLHSALRGIIVHNPDLPDLTLPLVFRRVVSILTHAGLLIVLDNHVSTPQSCCSDSDGNGFFGDEHFDVDSWSQGLSVVASSFIDLPEVVAISIRNELRGPRQNVKDWYRYMSLGANAVHHANPKLLVILSGLHYDTDLHFLVKNPIRLGFPEKLVYEMHWYASSYGVNFGQGNLNNACAIATSSIMKCGGFVTTPNTSYTAPLFISEFGIDQRGADKAQSRFISCLFAFVASMDLDWAYWPLQGSYYIRNGHMDDEEFFGVLNARWSSPRNLGFVARLQAIQQPWQRAVSGGARAYQVIFHPASGLCLQKSFGNSLLLGPCTSEGSTHWRYTPQGRIEMVNSYFCVGVEGEDQPAKLMVTGTERNGPWTMVSIAKMQLATSINHSLSSTPSSFNHNNTPIINNNNLVGLGQSKFHHEDNLTHDVTLCLDGSNPPYVTSKRCICVQVDDMDCGPDDDPSTQWFVLINATTPTSTAAITSTSYSALNPLTF